MQKGCSSQVALTLELHKILLREVLRFVPNNLCTVYADNRSII